MAEPDKTAPSYQEREDRPSFSSTTDDPLATAGTGGSEEPKDRDRRRERNPARVGVVPERDAALDEGPGPAEGHTDNKAGG